MDNSHVVEINYNLQCWSVSNSKLISFLLFLFSLSFFPLWKILFSIYTNRNVHGDGCRPISESHGRLSEDILRTLASKSFWLVLILISGLPCVPDFPCYSFPATLSLSLGGPNVPEINVEISKEE